MFAQTLTLPTLQFLIKVSSEIVRKVSNTTLVNRGLDYQLKAKRSYFWNN